MGNCQGCKHNGKYENEIELGYPSPCTKCSRRCPDNFEPLKIKDGECFCISCKKIITDKKIFPYKDNKNKGLCFNCY